MKNGKTILVVGALALIGGAAAIAQTGEGRRGGDGWRGHDSHGDHGRGHHRGFGRGGDGHEGHGWREGRGRGARNREMTLEDIETRARERFARFDKNGDNVLDASEIEARFTERREGRRGRRGGGMRMGMGMIRRFDQDNDGKVTKAEFDQSLQRRFQQIDLNNDGRITDADLPPMLRGRNILAGNGDRQGMRGRGHRGMRMFGQLRGTDANKDGAVTLEEFAARANERFQRMDHNKDGTVDQADSDAMRKEMVSYRVARFIHRFGPEADKARSVTRDQFLGAAKERFNRMDRNRDGTVNREDRSGRGGGGRGPADGNR
ncbi:MAG: hypothetical protein RLZ98_992 [Pseudomonadota bacterium]|jgi:Ca2+-binding EF-hand superfamily protein